jgi:hypothetical protein
LNAAKFSFADDANAKLGLSVTDPALSGERLLHVLGVKNGRGG